MAKIRIHELSRELGVENKELIGFFESKGVEVKNHMSALEEADANLARNHFTQKLSADKPEASIKENKAENKTEKASEAHKTSENTKAPETPKASEASEAPKKKNIIRVVRPQNSQQGMSNNRNRNQKDSNGRRPSGNRPNDDRNRSDRNPGQNRDSSREKFQDRPQIRFENARPARRPDVRTSAESVEDIKSAKERIARAKQAAAPAPKHHAAPQEAVKTKVEDIIASTGEVINSASTEETDKISNNPEIAAVSNKESKSNAGKDNKNFSKSENRNDNRNSDGKKFNRNDSASDNRPGKHNDVKGDKDFGDSRKDGKPAGKNDFRKKNDNSGNNEGSQKASGKDNSQKRKGHKDIKNYDQDQEERQNAPRKAGAFNKPVKAAKPKVEEEAIKLITVPTTITIQELADKMKLQPSAIVKKLFMKGTIVTINQEIEYEMAEEIAMEFDVLCEPEKVVDLVEEMLKEEEESGDELKKRPPVVCVMGHVDHGKTSLLDAIRHTRVIDKEAGGITQHIGAYVVNINGESITFLDTPGHEAFTAMRMRGASSTDIAVLVVAADDGVMPQTIEAINHAKAAGVEIIVAINKIDKPGANIERVKQELTEYELIPEDWGGSTVFCPVSAKTGEGLNNLLEMIVLTSEVLELKANPRRTARGLVLEAQLDKGKGPVATVLVQKGTLHVGDPVAAGIAYGKVRAMMDDKGRRVKEAGPSTPVEILGLNDVPGAGDVFIAPDTDKEARSFAETYISQNKVHMLSENKSRVKMSLDDLYAQIKEGNLKELDIIVKADVQGSVEAVKQSLEKLSNDEIIVKVIHGGVGAINESDVMLASASNAIIIGFNVRPDAQAKDNAEREGVDMRLYRVIYNAIEDIEAAMKGMLDPEFKEQVIGHADIRQTFKASGVGTIAGAYVTDGRFDRSAQVRLIRDGIVVYEGTLASLRRFKDDVKEVKSGYECGFVFDNYNDIKEGDQVEAFMMVEVPR